MISILKKIYIKMVIFILKLPFLNNINTRRGNNYFHEIKSLLDPHFKMDINDRKYTFMAHSYKTFRRFNKLLLKEPDTISWINSIQEDEIF